MTSDDIRPLEPVELLRAGGIPERWLSDSEGNISPDERQTSCMPKGVTPLVRPGDQIPVRDSAGAGAHANVGTGGRTKEEIIAEVARRVMEELKAGGTV